MKHFTRRMIAFSLVGLVMFYSGNAYSSGGSSAFIVRNADTAIGFAEAVIRQEYGKAKLKELSPLTAIKNGDKWIVRGAVDKRIPKQTRGGIVFIEIAATGGAVLSIHYEI